MSHEFKRQLKRRGNHIFVEVVSDDFKKEFVDTLEQTKSEYEQLVASVNQQIDDVIQQKDKEKHLLRLKYQKHLMLSWSLACLFGLYLIAHLWQH